LNTTDGGSHWNSQKSGTTKALREVFFINAQNGWTVGEEGTILNTSDGGMTWVKQPSVTSEHLLDIYFHGKNGWIVGAAGTILRLK